MSKRELTPAAKMLIEAKGYVADGYARQKFHMKVAGHHFYCAVGAMDQAAHRQYEPRILEELRPRPYSIPAIAEAHKCLNKAADELHGADPMMVNDILGKGATLNMFDFAIHLANGGSYKSFSALQDRSPVPVESELLRGPAELLDAEVPALVEG